jgi:ankyrin repeat protein
MRTRSYEASAKQSQRTDGDSHEAQRGGSRRHDSGSTLAAPTVISKATVELSLAQHLFSSFMWAIAPHISSEKLSGKDKTSISRGDLFRTDDPDTLLSLRLENTVLNGIAKAVQQSGLGTLEEAYMCIIPPLSRSKILPIEGVVEFVRQRIRDHEVLGHWQKVVGVYVKLFQISKPLGLEHRDFRKMAALLIDAFLSINDILKLKEGQRRKDGVEELERLQDEILRELVPNTESDPDPEQRSLRDLVDNFRKLLNGHKRPIPDQWNDLVSPNNVKVADIRKITSRDDGKLYVEGDIFGWTALHYAAVRGNKNEITELLQQGADPKAIDFAERTPLHYAIDGCRDCDAEEEWGPAGVVHVLVRGGADTEMRGRDGMGALHSAARKPSAAATNRLLQAGATVDIQDNARRTPLHWGAYTGSVDVIKALLNKGAYEGSRDDYGRIPLHFAAVAGKHEAMEELLKAKNVEIDSRDQDGRTPLHLAAMQGHGRAVKVLVGKKAENVVDRSHCNAQPLTAMYGHESSLQQVLAKDREAKDSEAMLALLLGVLFARKSVVQELREVANDSDITLLLKGVEKLYVSLFLLQRSLS